MQVDNRDSSFLDNASLDTTLCNGMRSLYHDAQLTDISVKAGSTEINAHKVVLAAHSPCFKAMFQASHPATHVLFLQTCFGCF